jgi:hypothetical protein
MSFKIYYGVVENKFDITDIVYKKCMYDENIIYIPESEQKRCAIFGDPLYGILKCIFVKDEKRDGLIFVFDYTKQIYIDTKENKIYNGNNVQEHIKKKCN